jgi:hypothetical protein
MDMEEGCAVPYTRLKTQEEGVDAARSMNYLQPPSPMCHTTRTKDENGIEIFEPIVFVFYIMIPFSNIKICQFQLVSQPFSIIFFCTL